MGSHPRENLPETGFAAQKWLAAGRLVCGEGT